MGAFAFLSLAQFAAEMGQFGLELAHIHPVRLHHGADYGVRQKCIQSGFAVAEINSRSFHYLT